MDVLPVGMGAYVMAKQVVAIVPVDSAPVRWLVRRAEEAGRLIDATRGRRTRAIIRMANGDVLLSALQPETLARRLRSKDAEEGD